ncbi:unnamed protein product [Meloidogyne enterolobii]|uniref:Uncharacterized protein n=1 Tax=Meloidogyne enterolobii TaxID=390850 RepID=A0ACB1B4W7_MELEN
MDTIEKQLPIIEKHEVLIEELNEEKDEERFEDEEEKEDEEEGIVKEEEEEKGEEGKVLEDKKDTTLVDVKAGLTEEKTGRDVKEEKEVKEEKIKLGRDIKKGFEILPKIGNRKEGKLSTKKIGEFKKQHLEKQQKLPSIPPLDIRKCTRQHPSSSTLIKTKKEIPRLDRIEKTTKEDKSKKDEKEVFVLVKGHRVFDGHERKTPNPLFSIRREDKQKEEKRILSKQKQQKIELNEKKRTELKKDVQPIIKYTFF